MAQRSYAVSERTLLLFLTLIIFGESLASQLLPFARPNYGHLGAEYFNIARALVDGRGFSDPFGEATGPTAWMPPLFPALLAALLLVLKKKSAVAMAVVFLRNTTSVVVGMSLFRTAKACRTTLPPLLCVGLFVVWQSLYSVWFFSFTHDIWLLLLIATLIVAAIVRYVALGELRHWRWGLLGGVASLASPAIAVAWGAVTLSFLKTKRRDRKRLWLSLALALSIATPWTLRNATIFHKFIPTKSNLFFDAEQANTDDDGILSHDSLADHPYNSPETRFRYAQRGEARFIEENRAQFLESVRRAPAEWVRRVFNRAVACTLLYPPLSHSDESGVLLVVERIVFALPFVAVIYLLWIRGLDDHRESVPRDSRGLDDHRESVPRDSRGLDDHRAHPAATIVKHLSLFYVVYLSPYVLVTFYARYIMPLSSLLVLFTFIGIDRFLARRVGLSNGA